MNCEGTAGKGGGRTRTRWTEWLGAHNWGPYWGDARPPRRQGLPSLAPVQEEAARVCASGQRQGGASL